MRSLFIAILLLAAFGVNAQILKGYRLETRTEMRYDTAYNATGNEPVGATWYDGEERTISVALGNGVVMQVNQESLIPVYNNTSDTIYDGRVCTGAGASNDRITIELASKKKRYTALLVTTENIPPNSRGLAVELAGRVNGVNTGNLSAAPIFLDTLGLVSNNKGVFPDYNYPLGAVVKVGTTDGIIQFRSDGTDFKNSIADAFDGIIRESFD